MVRSSSYRLSLVAITTLWIAAGFPGLPLALSLDADTGDAAAENAGSAESPSIESVTRRAVVVAAVYSLRFHPHSGEHGSEGLIDALEDERYDTLFWFQTEDLWTHASEWEQQVLRAPVGSLTLEDLESVHALGDDLQSLLFALGVQTSLPSPDGTSVGPFMLDALPKVGASVKSFDATSRLTDVEDLRRARDLAELWWLRASIQHLIDSDERPDDEALASMAGEIREEMEQMGLEPATISDNRAYWDELVRVTAHWAHQEGLCEAPIDDDLPVRGQPFRNLEAFTKATLFRQATNRIWTLNWLMGSEAGSE